MIEDALKPVEGDSAAIALLRRTMSDDHFENRVTLEQSVHNPLNVFGSIRGQRLALFLAFQFFVIIIEHVYLCAGRASRSHSCSMGRWQEDLS